LTEIANYTGEGKDSQLLFRTIDDCFSLVIASFTAYFL